MIKKINTYNELAKQFGESEKQLYMHHGFTSRFEFSTYKELKAFINEEYVEEFGKAILECNEWDFDKSVQITAWQYGTELKSDPNELYFGVCNVRC